MSVTSVYAAHRKYLEGEVGVAREEIAEATDYASKLVVEAEIALSLGDIERAKTTAREALRRCPNSPRAILLVETLGDARPTFADLFDDEAPAIVELGFVPTAQPMIEEVASTAETADIAEPDVDSPGLISETLARLLIQQNRVDEARKVYIQLARSQPSRYEYYRSRIEELAARARLKS